MIGFMNDRRLHVYKTGTSSVTVVVGSCCCHALKTFCAYDVRSCDRTATNAVHLICAATSRRLVLAWYIRGLNCFVFSLWQGGCISSLHVLRLGVVLAVELEPCMVPPSVGPAGNTLAASLVGLSLDQSIQYKNCPFVVPVCAL